jgi:hypothetical protein
MERFYFDIHRPESEVPDNDGAPAPNLDFAVSQAIEAVRESIRRGRIKPSDVEASVLVIRDAKKRVVANVPLIEAIRPN